MGDGFNIVDDLASRAGAGSVFSFFVSDGEDSEALPPPHVRRSPLHAFNSTSCGGPPYISCCLDHFLLAPLARSFSFVLSIQSSQLFSP